MEPGRFASMHFLFLDTSQYLLIYRAGGTGGEESTCQCRRHRQEMWVQSLGREDTLEEEGATQSSVLAWKIPCAEEPAGLQSMRLQRVLMHTHTHTHIYTHMHTHSTSPSLLCIQIQLSFPSVPLSGEVDALTVNRDQTYPLVQSTPQALLCPLQVGCIHRPQKGRGFASPTPVQFSSVIQSRLTLCDPMNRSTPGLPRSFIVWIAGYGAVWIPNLCSRVAVGRGCI